MNNTMKNKINKIYFLPIILFGVLFIFFFKSLSQDNDIPSALVNLPLPKASVVDINNHEYKFPENFYNQKNWSLINVWASWCDNCTMEHFFIEELAKTYEIYAINYKDTASNAQSWLKTWGNPYKNIIFDNKGALSFDLGVFGVPETFLIDSRGIIRYRYAGVLTKDIWNEKFKPIIEKLEK